MFVARDFVPFPEYVVPKRRFGILEGRYRERQSTRACLSVRKDKSFRAKG